MLEAARAEAARGELRIPVPIGYDIAETDTDGASRLRRVAKVCGKPCLSECRMGIDTFVARICHYN